MRAPLVGHLDPAFIAMMEDVKAAAALRVRDRNPLTLPISGTGSAGHGVLLVNLVEPGDEVVVGVNGVFGTRMAEVVERAGATRSASRRRGATSSVRAVDALARLRARRSSSR
jgi:alanine-glyoxylate transaminase/serine-glyoxylate transaminase/serine-pyruvate transaminase